MPHPAGTPPETANNLAMGPVPTEAVNPILPTSYEVVYVAVGIATLLIPIVIVAFVVRQVVMTRRAAERAADAVERLGSPG